MKRKFPVSSAWIIPIVLLYVVYIVSIAPRVSAQGREQAPPNRHVSVIGTVYEFIQRNFVEEIDTNILFEGAMTGMLNSLGDPHSAFLPESEMSNLSNTTQGNFGGVGLYVFKPAPVDGRPSFLEVSSPIEGTPGWRAGISPGDQIIQINGENTDVLSSDEAVSRLRGIPGTDVEILIRRGERLEFPVVLTRAIVEVPTVRFSMIGNDIGYVRLITFTPMTVDRTRDAINDFQAHGYRGLIVDLRNNAGGLLSSAVSVSSLFLDGGVVVSTRSRIPTENQVFQARGRPIVQADIPIIVLINRGSASASEIVAGALKDRGRAFLVGERTHGKGSVQQVYPLDSVGFKLTTARYYTPSNASIDGVGVPPDREVHFPDFTDTDAEQLGELINSRRIIDFVAENPDATASQRENFARILSRDYGLDVVLLSRLIRNEQNRTAIEPVYDLEYDVQLQEAVKILREENFRALMQNSTTLRELQEREEETFLIAS
ncbi:MAG: S41 family peptidase [Treponema sp.]|nr:S41 family peptidase [Treponema sp.]